MITNLKKILKIHEHDFDLWKIIKEGKIIKNKKVLGTYILQRRICKTCGYVQDNCQDEYITKW